VTRRSWIGWGFSLLANYRAALSAPGSAAFSAAGFVMRMPIAMYPIGILLIVSGRDGRYGFAGVVSACYIAGAVPGNPILARLVDRYGQRRLLLPATTVHIVAIGLLGVLFETGAPDWTLPAPALLAGFAYLSVESLIRARWALALAGRPELNTAYSLESTLDEVIFVAGPLIATVLATQVLPVLVLAVGVALVGSGAVWLSTQTATEPPPYAVGEPRRRSALRERGMGLLVAGAVAMGALFSSAEVSIVAFCGQHGHRSLSGAVLACLALGSGIAGFIYGARTHKGDVLSRFRQQALVFAVLPALFLVATSVPVLAVTSFVVGFGIAPTLINAFGLVERMVAAGSLTEGIAWLLTGLNLGYGAGSALVGGIADHHGARLAFLVTVGSGLLMGALALLLHRRLTGSEVLAPQPAVLG
jgi:MFS family permease